MNSGKYEDLRKFEDLRNTYAKIAEYLILSDFNNENIISRTDVGDIYPLAVDARDVDIRAARTDRLLLKINFHFSGGAPEPG
jgi:hypothetical protein